MRIAVDESIPGAVEVFGRLGDVRLFPGRSITSADLAEADALVIRSVTPVTAELLKNTPVRFVGTATSGTDHVDILHLQKCGIQFADAAGCNTRAVAEYLIAAIVRVAARGNGRISGKTIGIVGCGRIGSEVSQMCHSLDMTVLHNDPPLAREGRLKNHVEIDALLPACDFVTVHVPLTMPDSHDARGCPTRGMVDAAWLAKMKRGAVFINTSRGEIIHPRDLAEFLADGRIRAIFDVWPGEPDIDPALARLTSIATPHLAGYSLLSKRRATAMIARALADRTGQTEKTADFLDEFVNSGSAAHVTLSPAAAAKGGPRDSAAMLHAVLSRVCSLDDIDRAVRVAIEQGRIAQSFDRIRAAYAARNEWSQVALSHEDAAVRAIFISLGFRTR